MTPLESPPSGQQIPDFQFAPSDRERLRHNYQIGQEFADLAADIEGIVTRHLRSRLALLEQERERLTRELEDWRNREAAVCPEDFGFEEVIAELRKDRERLRGLLERERSAAVRWLSAARTEIRRRRGMAESRGSYAWDDDEYRKEFGRALNAIGGILDHAETETHARDLTDCPTTQAEVDAARSAPQGDTAP